MIRLENINDLYDKEATSTSINLHQFAIDLYNFVNPSPPTNLPTITIEEVTISGWQPIGSLLHKHRWRGKGDSPSNTSKPTL